MKADYRERESKRIEENLRLGFELLAKQVKNIDKEEEDIKQSMKEMRIQEWVENRLEIDGSYSYYIEVNDMLGIDYLVIDVGDDLIKFPIMIPQVVKKG